MENVKITVYVPSHNYGRYLQEAIESVLRQTVDNWELLLINDKSTDNTQDILELYRGDPRIRIYQTDKIGLPSVANLALKKARGEYLIRLDADDIFDENILLVLSNYLDRHKDIALIFPDYFLMDDHGGIISYEGRATIYQYNHLLDIPAHGACTMIRKKVLEEIGGYRVDLGSQDGFDLWTKVTRSHKCANVSVPLFYYRRHGENLTENTSRILNARRTIKKDAATLDLHDFRPITAIIPTRRNYDFFRDLWNQQFTDRTLLEIALETCVQSKIFDQIIVTSDNPDVQESFDQFKDDRIKYVERSTQLTTISRSISETLYQINQAQNLDWKGTSVLSYIQTPFVETPTLEEAVYTLVLNNADSAFAVEEMHEPLYKRTPHGLMPITPQQRMRSDFDLVYAASRSSTATRNINLKTGSFTGARISHFVIPEEEAFFIRSKRDYKIAQNLLLEKQKVMMEP